MNLANDFWVLGKNVSKWNHSLMQFCEVGWCLCTVIASSLPRALQIWGASGFWVLRLGFRSGLFDRRHWGRMEEILGLRELNEWRKKNPGRMVCAQRLPSILSKDFWTHLHLSATFLRCIRNFSSILVGFSMVWWKFVTSNLHWVFWNWDLGGSKDSQSTHLHQQLSCSASKSSAPFWCNSVSVGEIFLRLSLLFKCFRIAFWVGWNRVGDCHENAELAWGV